MNSMKSMSSALTASEIQIFSFNISTCAIQNFVCTIGLYEFQNRPPVQIEKEKKHLSSQHHFISLYSNLHNKTKVKEHVQA